MGTTQQFWVMFTRTLACIHLYGERVSSVQGRDALRDGVSRAARSGALGSPGVRHEFALEMLLRWPELRVQCGAGADAIGVDRRRGEDRVWV